MGKKNQPTRQKITTTISRIELDATRRRLGLTTGAQLAALEAAAEMTRPHAAALYQKPGERWSIRPARPGQPPRADTGILIIRQ